MRHVTTHLAIDLGAGSGRIMAGHFDGKTLRLEEISRFENNGVLLPTGWHWQSCSLFSNIQNGIAKAASAYNSSLVSAAVDTWGVDYGLLDVHGRLLGDPWMYRDTRTDGMMEVLNRLIPKTEVYRRTGIQFMFFNTIFQLLAEARQFPETLAVADQLLFMPDLLTYWLSGERIIERTIASTSQLLKAGQSVWDMELIRKLKIPVRIFKSITEPGQMVGTLRTPLANSFGSKLKIVTCGSHDTASAVAGIPTSTKQPLFLSSGTWSLIGRELTAPFITQETEKAGFSNEQGVFGTVRFLKNVAGMWLIQECKRVWDSQGKMWDYASLIQQADRAKTDFVLNPDAAEFSKSCDMPTAICEYAKRTGQQIPETPGEFVRAVLQSLALRYRQIIEQMRQWMPDLPDTLHIVGGGSQNALLNQMTANATGLQVIAGPTEATAAGNIVLQLFATGAIDSLESGRSILQSSFQPILFEPQTKSHNAPAFARFEELINSQ